MKRFMLPIVLPAVWACLFVGLVDAGAQTLKPRYGGILKMHGYDPYCIGYPASNDGPDRRPDGKRRVESLFRFDEKAELVPLLATGWKADAKAKTDHHNLAQRGQVS